MKTPPMFSDRLEAARLKALRDYEILDSVAEEAFDRLTQLAATFYQAPISLISLVDAERQWFKSRVGLDARQTPRDLAFCAHAIHGEDTFIVRDTFNDPRFADNPLVTQPPNIRFYAGAPLTTRDGYKLGTLCIIDDQPRPDFLKDNAEQLELLAKIVISEMDSRLQNKALERAMLDVERATRARSDFLSLISHEIRTPLSAVVGLSDRLAEDTGRVPEPAVISGLQASSKQLMGLLNDVLDFAKVEAGKIQISPVIVAPERLLRIVRETWSGSAREKGLQLDLELDATLPDSVVLDELRAGQVLSNLVNNAVKFTTNGKITVRLESDPIRRDHLRLIVDDTGIGMTEAQIKRLFEPFEQAESGIARRHGGTGLGMAICAKLVHLMGGQIECCSEPDKGTRITVCLPYAIPDRFDLPFRSRKVLIVDDIDLNRQLVGHMLRKLGHEVVLAESGVEAVRLASQDQFDLILMDIRMPEMDGFEAGRRIHEISPEQKIIALSADAASEDKARAKQAGMLDYVTKPVTIDALKTVMERIEGGTA